MPNSFDFRGVRCFASAKDPATWYVLPRHPNLQRGADGRPILTLIDMRGTAYLLFAATWAASREDLRALRDEICARFPATRGDALVLGFAPVASTRCDVLMGDGRGLFETVASSATSGLPPYDATFNLYLQGERLAHAKSALRGEPGRLAVEYNAELRTPVSARADFYANGADLGPAMQGVHEGAALRQALDRAVEAGRARVVIDSPDPDASHLATELYDRVLDRAAELLPQLMRQGGSGDLHVTAALEQEIGQPTRAFADVGTLIAAETMESDTGGQDASD